MMLRYRVPKTTANLSAKTRAVVCTMSHKKEGVHPRPFSEIVTCNILDVAQEAGTALRLNDNMSNEQKADEITRAMVNAVISGSARVLLWLIECCSKDTKAFATDGGLGAGASVLIKRQQIRTPSQAKAEAEWCQTAMLTAQNAKQRLCYAVLFSYISGFDAAEQDALRGACAIAD